MVKHSQVVTESQAKALIAHLRDYIHLMDTIWPNEDDGVKARARALLADCTKGSKKVLNNGFKTLSYL
jgi:hypothetical protein